MRVVSVGRWWGAGLENPYWVCEAKLKRSGKSGYMTISELYGNDCIKGRCITGCMLPRKSLRRAHKRNYVFLVL